MAAVLPTVEEPPLTRTRPPPGRAALLVIDVQNDFLDGGSLAVPHGMEVVPLINDLLESIAWDLVVYTRDAHPANHVSFASSHDGPPPLFSEIVLPDGSRQVMWPDHCVEGTFGSQLASTLVRTPDARDVRKGTHVSVDSYSGFGDAMQGAVERTELADLLSNAGIDHVYVAGLALDYCVAYSCRDSVRLGFATTCLAWASRGIKETSVATAIDAMRSVGVEVDLVPNGCVADLPRRISPVRGGSTERHNGLLPLVHQPTGALQ